MVASNVNGITNGNWITFVTLGGGPVGLKPTIVSANASNITTTSATFNGSVNPNGSNTDAWFHVGTPITPPLGFQNIGSGNSLITLTSCTLTGLTPNTTYSFRVEANNPNGTTNGSWITFTTLNVNPSGSIPTIISANATPGSTSAVLDGSVNPNGDNTTAWFETPSFGPFQSQSIGNGNSPVTLTSYTLTGLTPNTIYTFRVVAQNTYGTTTGNWVTFTTLPGNNLTPTLLSISPTSGTQGQNNINVNLNGTGFVGGSTVIFSGSGIILNSTNINSTTSITVNISINSNATIGGSNVFVINNNGTSNSQTFTVFGSTSCITPNISYLNPSSVFVGAGTTNVTIQGSNFTNGSTAMYNGGYRATNFINSNNLTITLNSSDLAYVGSGNITVSNGTNCISNANTFFINSFNNGGGGGGGWNGGGGGGGGHPVIYYISVITQNATNVLRNSATLLGSINPNNQSTTAWFEYGTSYNLSSYNETSHIFFGSGGYSSTLSQGITNLNPNTTYYFRAVGNNYAGTIRGDIFSFTTNSSANIINNNTTSGNNNIISRIIYQNYNNDNYTNDTSSSNPNNQISNYGDYFSNKNLSASAVLGFTNILPKTFLGWLIFLVLILLIIVIARKLYEDYSYQKIRNKVDASHIENLPV